MLTRRDLLRASASVPAAALPLSLLTIDGARAQAIDLLKIFVPAAPGGGWDQTARTIEQVLRATGAVKGVQITNVGGAGGAVGLPQFLNQWKGQGNALMVGGMVMVGAIIANKSPVKLAQATPIARLTGEFLALVVPAQSPFKSAKDFAAALKADPAKVPVAGGSAGGSDHILLGMIAKALGVPPTKVSYVAFAGGGPATAALLGNQVAAGISGYGEFAEQVKAGKLRIIAVSADKRQEGIDGADPEGGRHRRRAVQLARRVRASRRERHAAQGDDRADGEDDGDAAMGRGLQDARLDPDHAVRRRVQGLPGNGDGADRKHPQGTRARLTWPAGARRSIRPRGCGRRSAKPSSASACWCSPSSWPGRRCRCRYRRSTPRSGPPSSRSSPRSRSACSASCCWSMPCRAAGSPRRRRRSRRIERRCSGSSPGSSSTFF